MVSWHVRIATRQHNAIDAQGGGGLGFSTKEYMTMLMVSVCVFAVFIVLSCVFADRLGRRRVIIGSLHVIHIFGFMARQDRHKAAQRHDAQIQADRTDAPMRREPSSRTGWGAAA